MKSNDLYPIFLKLDQFQILIVGGGNIGLEKIQFITRQSPNARINVVSKTFSTEIERVALKKDNILLIHRGFHSNDLNGIKLLIVATDDSVLNKEIVELAQSKNILTNVVDNPELCDFYTAAIMQKGPIKIAVSSNGTSPTLAKRIRDILEEVIPSEIENTAETLKNIRANLKGNLNDKIKVLNSVTSLLSVDHLESSNLKNDQKK